MEACRRDGKLVIEISEDALCDGTRNIPGREAEVIDREKFLNFCAAHICRFGDSGDFRSASRMTQLIDDLVAEAIESDEGVRPWRPTDRVPPMPEAE